MSLENRQTTVDQILDLLLDALTERQQVRQGEARLFETPATPEGTEEETAVTEPMSAMPTEQLRALPPTEWELEEETADSLPDIQTVLAKIKREEEASPIPPPIPDKLPPIHLEKMLGRLTIALTLLILLVNIPFNRHGTTLAKAMPDEQAFVIRDGTLLKGEGDKVYVLENNQKRWITTLEAFEKNGYRWEQVHEVDEAFLAEFPDGRPIYLLLKCATSPHIYAFNEGRKLWIEDMETFEAQGYIWEDIQFVGCAYLRNLPDGIPIPADAGPPPQP